MEAAAEAGSGQHGSVGSGARVGVILEQVSPDKPEARELIAELEESLEPFYRAESRHGLGVEELLVQGVDFFWVCVDGYPAGCGGILWCDGYGELKRMYVRPAFRGQGIGRRLIEHLAEQARRRSCHQLRLETGIHQSAAIRLYESAGFRRIDPFAGMLPTGGQQ